MKITATQVITVRVYAVADAFVVVRENAASVVDGITSGNSATNSPATARAIVTKVPMNAQPSRPREAISTPPSRASGGEHEQRRAEPTAPVMACVHTRNTTATTAVARPSRTERRGPGAGCRRRS